jgi:hypothetical protein
MMVLLIYMDTQISDHLQYSRNQRSIFITVKQFQFRMLHLALPLP